MNKNYRTLSEEYLFNSNNADVFFALMQLFSYEVLVYLIGHEAWISISCGIITDNVLETL